MEAGRPHVGATFAGRRVTVEQLRRQLAAYEPSMPRCANNLPADLKTEAEVLAAELSSDLDALTTLWGDLRQREHLLTREECIAATYAIWLALCSPAPSMI